MAFVHTLIRKLLAGTATNSAKHVRHTRESWYRLPLIVLFTTLTLFGQPALATGQSFQNLINKLPSSKLRGTPALVDEIATLEDNRSLPVFEHLLAGKLYYIAATKQVIFLGEKNDDAYAAVGVLDGAEITGVGSRQVRKIRVNNKLRKQLRRHIAKLTLFSEEADVREAAIDNLMKDLSKENIALLSEAREAEPVDNLKEQIDVALNVARLDSTDIEVRRHAIQELSGVLHPQVRNRLRASLEKNEDGAFIEEDSKTRAMAANALKSIESRLQLYGVLERVLFGLSLGSVLLLAAIGLSITFGVMGVINMAHGELLMLGAYTTYVIQLLMPNQIGLSIFLAIPAAFLVCGLVGIAIERGVIQFLKGRPLETLLATFGLSLILQQSVRTVFSPLNRQVSTPEFMSGAWEINAALSLTYNRLYIILFSLLVFALLLIAMKRTSLGLYVRAVSQNRDMAKAVGIRSEWIDSMTFGLGSGIAGVAGVALSQLTNVGPNLGQSYIIDSFMVVVFGGVGNLWGTLVGALSLGVMSKFLEPVTGTVLAQILVLIFIVLFIQVRPRGLFPQQGRAAES